METEFKETEIGDILQHWEVVRLGEFAKTQSGGTPSRKKPDYFNGSIPWVKSGELEDNVIYHTGESITQEGLANSSAKIFPVGTLLIALYGATVGKTAILGIDASTNQAICAIFPKDNLFLSEFLRFYFIFTRANLLDARYGGAQPNISQTIVKNIKFPLPPLTEQQKIATVLSAIQQAIEQQDKIIASVMELKKTLMRKLFTEGLGDAEFKETEIGMMPKHWDVVRLGDVVTSAKYGISMRGIEKGKYPILRMNNLNDGSVDTSDLQYVDLEDEIFNKFQVSKQDILFNRTNSLELVGKTAIFNLEGQFVFASYLVKVVADRDKLNPRYLNYYLNWDVAQNRLKMLATRGAGQYNISATKLKSFEIPFPSLTEQKKIARILSTIDDKIAVEENRKRLLQELFKTMLHKLMTGGIRVNELDLS